MSSFVSKMKTAKILASTYPLWVLFRLILNASLGGYTGWAVTSRVLDGVLSWPQAIGIFVGLMVATLLVVMPLLRLAEYYMFVHKAVR